MLTDTWFTVATAAERLAVSEKTIRRMIARGELPARRLGRRLLRIDPAALAAVGRDLAPTAH